MLNTKQTLKNLHKKFPMLSLDELFEVLDCYVEESLFNPNPGTWTNKDSVQTLPKVWYDTNVTSITDRPLTSKISASSDIRAYNSHTFADHSTGE